MSTEALRDFWNKVDSDAGLARELDALFATDTHAASAASVVELAGRHGFSFTVDELKGHLSGELSDAELEAAAGGIDSFTWEQKATITMECKDLFQSPKRRTIRNERVRTGR